VKTLQASSQVRKIALSLGLRKIAPDVFGSGISETLRIMLDMLEPDPKAKLLDVGCGDGGNTLRYASKMGTRNVHAMEIVDEHAKIAQSRGIRVHVGDLNQTWPTRSENFDAIVSNQVIEHLWNTRLFVSEMYRVLVPRGYGVVATENLASWPNVLALLLGYQPFSSTNICGWSLGNPLTWHLEEPKNEALLEMYKDKGGGGAAGHVRVLAYGAFKEIFLAEGFQIQSLKGVGYFPFKGRISKLLSHLNPRHSHFMVIKVRKP